ncbi:MAG: septum formation inhibitor Maf [Gemmatimonadaceae bacterium]|nr:septum formation inhibitor Maf [Gemmatimonadaceae bacterium]
MLQVILASSSPRRRELLTLIGISHEVRPADINESILPGEIPVEHAERLARAKALTIAERNPSAVVIGSDTIVVIDGEILGKPVDEGDAHRMLRMLSGREHTVVTSVAVALQGEVVSSVEKVQVTFREISDSEILDYIATREPMDKAGSYGIQGFGATIIRKVDGDFFAVMGLSLVRLVDLLEQQGIRYSFSGGLISPQT